MDMNLVRSLLFVPGSRPDRFASALASGADAVIVDLEDAVPLADKAAARDHLVQFLSGRTEGDGAVPVIVRPNAMTTRDGLRDIDALLDVLPSLHGLLLPKADAGAMRILSSLLSATFANAGSPVRERPFALGALVETVRGLEECREIAEVAGVRFLMFGAADLSAELRCVMDWEPLTTARARMVAAAAGAGIAAIDTPAIDLGDLDAYAHDLRRSFAFGFTGRAAIHPKMIGPIHAALMPSAQQLAQDARILEAFERASGGVALVDGRLVERPLVAAALRRKALAAGQKSFE